MRFTVLVCRDRLTFVYMLLSFWFRVVGCARMWLYLFLITSIVVPNCYRVYMVSNYKVTKITADKSSSYFVLFCNLKKNIGKTRCCWSFQ